MKNYNFKNKTWMQITDYDQIDLPSFPAIIMRAIGDQCLLNTWDYQIYARLYNGLSLPKVGSMILITKSELIRYRDNRENRCQINDYYTIFEQVPDMLYK
jgi:hypothetical protein